MAFAVVTSLASADTAKSPLSTGINNLNYKVLNQIQKTEKSKNLFLSAFSIHAAVSMAYAGSAGSTQNELASLLGLNRTESMESLADTWSLLRSSLQGADEKVKLEIANSMWGNADQRVKFLPGFVALNQRAHDAELRTEDFQDDSFLGKINGWASEKTHGKIKKVLAGPIPKEQLFYLVNAIYFKGDWNKSFDKKNTREGDFTTVAAKTTKTKFMTQGGKFPYYRSEDGSVEAVQIPFGKTKRMVMSMYLPAEGSDFLSNIDLRKLEGMKLAVREGTITIPRFSIEYGNDEMVGVLKALGVNVAFSNQAQFPNVAEGEAIKINKIIHKAVIDVVEEGAEAAAVTVVGGIRATSVAVNPPFYFRADRPFYFEIKDTETDVVLFAGVLKDPNAKN